MKISNLKFGVLAAGAVLALTQGSARAAMESQTIDYGSASAPIVGSATESLAYDTFNTALGTLTSMNITLTSIDAGVSEVYDFNGSYGNGYTGANVSSGNETVSALGATTATSTLAGGPFAGTTTGLQTIAGIGPAQTLISAVSPSNLSAYLGNGSAEAFNLAITAGTVTSGGSYAHNELFFGGNAESYGSVVIQYNYVPVPEPGTFFAGAGLLAFVGLTLWRGKNVLPARA